MGPTLTDELRGCALMGAREHASELGRLREDRVRSEHEPGQIGRDIGARRRAGVVVAVQESLIIHPG
jgi:hypothetical protein